MYDGHYVQTVPLASSSLSGLPGPVRWMKTPSLAEFRVSLDGLDQNRLTSVRVSETSSDLFQLDSEPDPEPSVNELGFYWVYCLTLTDDLSINNITLSEPRFRQRLLHLMVPHHAALSLTCAGSGWTRPGCSSASSPAAFACK